MSHTAYSQTADQFEEYDQRESEAEAAAMRQMEADQASRQTIWACCFCGREAGTREPRMFLCCGAVNHVHEVYEDSGEPV